MSKYCYDDEPIRVSRDAGYSKIKSIAPEFRQKSIERMNNPNIAAGDWGLKEILAEVGIVVNPEKMTHLFKYNE